MKIHVAHVFTRHYEFDAYGATEKEALDALRRAWEAHYKQCRGGPLMYIWKELRPSVTLREVELSRGYRDKEPLG